MTSLFDNYEEEETESSWREVPQERFLSWSPEMQYAYCAARDIDAASHADRLEDAEWYLERAKSYQALATERRET